MKDMIVTFTYTNWRSMTSKRRVSPSEIVFQSTKWHPEKQWLLSAYDHNKEADRWFAMKDIKDWTPEDK